MTQQLTITRPDDWHLHLRDGEALEYTVPATAAYMGRAIIMPNLQPPVMYARQALEYRQRILAQRPEGSHFDPLMVLYLTDKTTPEMIHAAKLSKSIVAAKLYPAGATTNSDSGVTDLEKLDPVLVALAENEMPLLIHGEVTHDDIDVFDREKRFIDEVMKPTLARHPDLKIVFEHITTKEAAEFVEQAGPNVAATITVQHLAYNRNHMLVGGIKPHFYCLPILKRNIHQQKLQEVAISGNPKFFLGTDSAPHAKGAKESACGCAGCFSAFAAIELYAEIFEDLGALDKLEGFASHFGADFYNLPRNTDTITLNRKDWTVPSEMKFAGDVIVPIKASEVIRWQVEK
jgi:dihydroorotase